MKRLKTILIILVLAALPALAQEDLKIGKLFDNDYINEYKATEVVVQGKELKPYNLTLFHSVTFDNVKTSSEKIEEWIETDSREAYDKEVGRIKGKLYYGFFCLPPHKGKNRYLFYRNAALQADSKDQSLTVVYMEGYTTLEQLKKMFK
ncbi:MAG: hypothetical protein IKY31_05035 [Bacteroidaceae bacterium]|nr:hypothetical protein [Bacteroidaceae bacterium]